MSPAGPAPADPDAAGPAPADPDAAGPADVLIHVQHLLGIGHLRRISRIAAAIAEAGYAVTVASGGRNVAGLDFGAARLVQLPALASADDAFAQLVDAHGRPIDDAWRQRRRDALLALFRRTRPRLLLLELFPFGRRMLRFELLALLEAAAAAGPRPQVAVSLRDVLNPPRTADKLAWALDVTRHHVDRVLVHGDPALIRLEEVIPETEQIADRVRYTGYVGAPLPADAPATGEVLLSTGGGAVGGHLARTALAARARSRLADAPWRLLLGPNLPESEAAAIRAQAPEGVSVERSRPDFLRLLAGCRVAVSQAGYNTVVETLAAGVPAVLVPFAGSGAEQEQEIRARRIARLGGIEVVTEAELSDDTLAAAVDRADAGRADAGRSARPALAMDGAARTAELVGELLGPPRADAAPGPRGAGARGA